MKKKLYSLFIFILAIFAFLMPARPQTVDAMDSSRSDGIPYDTLTLGTNNRLVNTQTAYIPYGILNEEVQLASPEDMYLFNDNMYIADTGNKRIVVINSLDGSFVQEVKCDKFQSPKGVFVTENNIYVADSVAQLVFKFDHAGTLIREYGRPTEPLYGKSTEFNPIKIAVASSGYMYIVSDGTSNGLVTINDYGEFMGFVGINNATFSLRKYLYNIFVSGTDLAAQKPPVPTNVSIGNNGNVYTTNTNIAETFKRLNISGVNTLDAGTYYPTETVTDIAISHDNYTYICTLEGDIYEYDIKGNLLFKFNTKDNSNLGVFGLNNGLNSIEIDEKGNIYVMDTSKSRIQIYQRAGFVNLLHTAVDLYNDGRYLESMDEWETILKQNTNFALAHTAYGYALFKDGQNERALEEFRLSKNYQGYSQVYWEIRNQAIQQYTGTAILVLLAVYVLYKLAKFLLMRNAKEYKGKLVPAFVYNSKVRYDEKEKSKFELKFLKLKDELAYAGNIFKKPADMCYGIKKENKASYLSAIIVLVTFVVVYLLDMYASGFLFRVESGMGNAFTQILVVLAIFMLWCATNYLVSTLNDGEGWFKDFFIGSCYCLIPFIVIKIPMILLTHVLTFNESFLIDFANIVIYGYTAILFIIMIQYIHQYNFKETVKNILITIFGMVIFALMILLVYMFASQLIDFVVSIVKEVIFRV